MAQKDIYLLYFCAQYSIVEPIINLLLGQILPPQKETGGLKREEELFKVIRTAHSKRRQAHYLMSMRKKYYIQAAFNHSKLVICVESGSQL